MAKILPAFKPPRQEQHDRVFLEDAISRYKNRLLTASGYIYTIVKIYRQQGHRLNIPNPRSFYEHFQIPKSTFYRALVNLERAEGIKFQWEPIGGISMWWGEENLAVAEPELAVAEPEVAEPKYQRLNQLPQDIRTKFEAFVRVEWRKAKGQEIRSFHRFMEKPADFQSWWQKFQACPPRPAQILEVETGGEIAAPPSPVERELVSTENLKALFSSIVRRRT
jgi:hypothetical protein